MTFFNNNWLHFHYNFDSTQTTRQSVWDIFNYKSSISNIQCKDFLQELEISCIEIYQQSKTNNKNVGIFLSGGVDSEIIARTFVKLGLEFEPFFIRFTDGLNLHEKYYVDIFSKQTSKKINYVDLDVYKWCNDPNGFAHYMEKYHTYDLAAPIQMWARTQIPNEFSMISGNYEPHLFKWQTDETLGIEWYHFFDESPFMSRMNFCSINKYNDYPFFYLHRPELYLAYSKDPIVAKMIDNRYKLSLASTKKIMMEYYFPEMPVRPKFTGFEKLQPIWRNTFDRLIEEFGYQDGVFTIPHSKLHRLFNNG